MSGLDRKVGVGAAAVVAALALIVPGAASAALPKPGFYCGGTKDAQGNCQLGLNVYKLKGKTLVTASTRIPTKEFTCRPSGTKGSRGPALNKVFLGGMPLKRTGFFKGTERPIFGPPTLTVSGRFTTAAKVDVTFDKSFLRVGPPGENCSAEKRLVVKLKKQTTNKGLF